MPNLAGERLVSFTTRHWLVVATMLVVCGMWSNAAAADVDQLLQQASARAAQLRRDSATLESFTRSSVSWQSHAAQVNRIKEHVNDLGQTLSQLEAARDSAGKAQQAAIDRIRPVLEEMASNTTGIIDQLNQNPGRLTDPNYREFLRANDALSADLNQQTSDIVAFLRAEARFQDAKARLGP